MAGGGNAFSECERGKMPPHKSTVLLLNSLDERVQDGVLMHRMGQLIFYSMRDISCAMSYRIEFFNEEVQADVLGWPAGIRASFTRIAERMMEHGPNLGLPYTRAMGDGLFEIRAKGQEGIGRALFCTVVGKRIVILHGFIKKTEQTPARALDAARRRMKEVRS